MTFSISRSVLGSRDLVSGKSTPGAARAPDCPRRSPDPASSANVRDDSFLRRKEQAAMLADQVGGSFEVAGPDEMQDRLVE